MRTVNSWRHHSLHTGGVIAVEALARPPGYTTRELLAHARKKGRLIEVDVDLAARAIAYEAQQRTLLPLHVNLLAVSVASASQRPGSPRTPNWTSPASSVCDSCRARSSPKGRRTSNRSAGSPSRRSGEQLRCTR